MQIQNRKDSTELLKTRKINGDCDITWYSQLCYLVWDVSKQRFLLCLYWNFEWSFKFHISQDARHAAEEEIYTNLNQKIDQFLQLADYDWMTGDLGNKASDYLVDLIAFLRSTFAVFTHLPVSDHCFYFVHRIEKRVLKI